MPNYAKKTRASPVYLPSPRKSSSSTTKSSNAAERCSKSGSKQFPRFLKLAVSTNNMPTLSGNALKHYKGCEKPTNKNVSCLTRSLGLSSNMKFSECKAKSTSCVEKKEIQVFFLDGSFVSIVTNGKRLAGEAPFQLLFHL